MISRRAFTGGVLAAFGSAFLPNVAFGKGEKPLLRMGVLSDVHIGQKGCVELLERQLKYLDSRKVDLVLFPGDMVHFGRISLLETFCSCWERVFPGGIAADGRKVDRVVVTGNHEYCSNGWDYYWSRFSKEEQERDRFYYNGNHEKAWERLFGEKWEPVWRREIRGVTFVGAQHEVGKDPHADELILRLVKDVDPDKPLIYVQHAHPRGTCYGEAAIEGRAIDGGAVGRALSRFPKAIAFSGHSHLPLTDERMVWQGAFTSIGCGCAGMVATLGNGRRRANAGDPWGPDLARLMPSMPNYFDACAGMVVDVFNDRLILRRYSFAFNEPIGSDWSVPLPASPDGPYSHARFLQRNKAPGFPEDAVLDFAYCAKAPESAGTDYRGKKPCYRLAFPSALALSGARVFDYEIRAFADGREVYRCELYSKGYHVPESRSKVQEELLMGVEALPPKTRVSFVVVPRSSHGICGKALERSFETPEVS